MSEGFLFFAWFLIRPFFTKATSSSPAARVRGAFMMRGSSGSTPCSGNETLQKNNVGKLGNRKRTSIASPRQSVNKMEEIL
jgi:hypothetical protein